MENQTMENIDTNNVEGVEKSKKFNGYLRKNNRKKKVDTIESQDEVNVQATLVESDSNSNTSHEKEALITFDTPKFVPNEVFLENQESVPKELNIGAASVSEVGATEEAKVSAPASTNQNKEKRTNNNGNNAKKSFKVNSKKEVIIPQKTKKIQNVLKDKKNNNNFSNHKQKQSYHDNFEVSEPEIKTPEELALHNLFYTIRKEHNIHLFTKAVDEYFKYYQDLKQSTSDITILNYLALYNKDEFLEYTIKNYPVKLFDLNDNNLKTMVKYSMNKSPAIISVTLSLLEKHYENKIPHDIIECIIECSTQMMWREDSAKILFNWLTSQLRENDKKVFIEKTIEHLNLTFTYFIYDHSEYSSLLKKVFNPEDDVIKTHPQSKKLTQLIGQSEVAKRARKEKVIEQQEEEEAFLSVKPEASAEKVSPFEQTDNKNTLTLKKETKEEESASFNDDMFKARPTITIRRKKKIV
jgi:hypothetical protein